MSTSAGYQGLVYAALVWISACVIGGSGMFFILFGFNGRHRIIACGIGLLMLALCSALGWIGAALGQHPANLL